eukprot:COSAG01_NODE_26070_length_724_cov_1.270400_1_plen_35_part_01
MVPRCWHRRCRRRTCVSQAAQLMAAQQRLRWAEGC